ncbi:unnamed protein product [Lampetra planeri]
MEVNGKSFLENEFQQPVHHPCLDGQGTRVGKVPLLARAAFCPRCVPALVTAVIGWRDRNPLTCVPGRLTRSRLANRHTARKPTRKSIAKVLQTHG